MSSFFDYLFGKEQVAAPATPKAAPMGPAAPAKTLKLDDVLTAPRQSSSPFTGQGSSVMYNKGVARDNTIRDIQKEFPMSIDPNTPQSELDRMLDEANAVRRKRDARKSLRGNIDPEILENGSDEEVALAVKADYNRLLQHYPKDSPDVPNWLEDPLRTGFGFLEGGGAAAGDTIQGLIGLVAPEDSKLTEPALDRQYINRYRDYLNEFDPESYVEVRGNESTMAAYPEKSLIGGQLTESVAEGYLVGSAMYKGVNAIPAVQKLGTMGRGGRIMQYALQNIAVDVGIRTDMAIKNRQGVDEVVRGVVSSPSILFGFSSLPALGIGVGADLLMGKVMGLNMNDNLTNAAFNLGGNLVDFKGLRKDVAKDALRAMKESFVSAAGGDPRIASAAFDEAQNINAYARMHPDDVRGVQKMYGEAESRLLTLKKTFESATVTGKESRLAGLTGPQGVDPSDAFVPPKQASLDDLIKKYGSENNIPLAEIDNVEAARVAQANAVGADEMTYGLKEKAASLEPKFRTDNLPDEKGWHELKGREHHHEIVFPDGEKMPTKDGQMFRAMKRSDYEQAVKTGFLMPSSPEPGEQAGRIYFTAYPDASHSFARIYGSDEVLVTAHFDDLPKMLPDPHTKGPVQLNAYTSEPIDMRAIKIVGGPDDLMSSEAARTAARQVSGAMPQSGKPVPGPEFPDSFNDAKKMGFTGARGDIPEEGVKTLKGRDLGSEVVERVKKQNAKIPDEDIAAFREKQLLDDEGIDEIILRKRGIITNAEAVERAKTLKMTRENVLNLRQGEALNVEQMTAMRQQVQYEREVQKSLIQMRDAVDSGATQTFSKAERSQIMRALGYAEGVNMTDRALVNEAIIKQGMELKRMEIISYGAASEAGRTLQAQKMYVNSIDPRLRSILQKTKDLTQVEQDAIYKELFETDLNDPKAYLDMVKKIDAPDMFDKYAEWITSKFLWNPTTHVVNFTGNAARQTVDLFTQTATSIAEGKPGRALADIWGTMNGVGAGSRRAAYTLTNEGYAMGLSKFVEAGGSGPAIQGLKGEVVRAPFRMLTAADELFKGIATSRSIYRQAYDAVSAQGLTGKEFWKAVEDMAAMPSAKMLDVAEAEAKRMTFQEELDPFMAQIGKFRNPSSWKSTGGKAASSLVRTFVPFYKTPVNIFKQAMDFSPLGFRHAFEDLPKTAKINRVVEATVGTALMASVGYFVDKDFITGAAPTDPKEREQFYREGKVPYSFRIGDQWVQYKRLDPFATVVGLVADLKNKPEDQNAFSYAWYIFTEQMRDKTFLQGLQDLLDVFNSGGESAQWKVERIMKRLPGNIILPSIVGHTARAVDPVIRKSSDTTFLEEFLKQIPFASRTVDPKIDVFGNTVERSRSGLNYFFSPIDHDTQNISPLDAAMTEVGYLYPLPQDHFKYNGQEVTMSGPEYVKFSRAAGKELYAKASAMVEWEEYKTAPAEDKIKALQKIREKTMEAYKEAFVRYKVQQGDIDASILKKKGGSGLPKIPSPRGPKGPPQP